MAAADPDNEATFEVFVISSRSEEADAPKQAILSRLEKLQYDEDAVFAIKLSVEEAVANALKHGNCSDCSKNITIRFAVSAQKAVIVVRDEGAGFKPHKVPDCTSPGRLPLPNGRGLMLIQSYMDEVAFRDCGREIYLMKRR